MEESSEQKYEDSTTIEELVIKIESEDKWDLPKLKNIDDADTRIKKMTLPDCIIIVSERSVKSESENKIKIESENEHRSPTMLQLDHRELQNDLKQPNCTDIYTDNQFMKKETIDISADNVTEPTKINEEATIILLIDEQVTQDSEIKSKIFPSIELQKKGIKIDQEVIFNNNDYDNMSLFDSPMLLQNRSLLSA